MTPARETPVSAALPAPLAAAAERLRGIIRRLPGQAPSCGAARLLDRLLWPRLDAEQRRLLAERCVEVEVVEAGLRVRLLVGGRGFEVAPAGDTPVLVVRAQAGALVKLLRGQEDADRLFFDRALVMEGDTEYGRMLKNTLDWMGRLRG